MSGTEQHDESLPDGSFGGPIPSWEPVTQEQAAENRRLLEQALKKEK